MNLYLGSQPLSPSPKSMFTLYSSLSAITVWLIQYFSRPFVIPHPHSHSTACLPVWVWLSLSCLLYYWLFCAFLHLDDSCAAHKLRPYHLYCASRMHVSAQRNANYKIFRVFLLSFFLHAACSITDVPPSSFLYSSFMFRAQAVDSIVVLKMVMLTAKIQLLFFQGLLSRM